MPSRAQPRPLCGGAGAEARYGKGRPAYSGSPLGMGRRASRADAPRGQREEPPCGLARRSAPAPQPTAQPLPHPQHLTNGVDRRSLQQALVAQHLLDTLKLALRRCCCEPDERVLRAGITDPSRWFHTYIWRQIRRANRYGDILGQRVGHARKDGPGTLKRPVVRWQHHRLRRCLPTKAPCHGRDRCLDRDLCAPALQCGETHCTLNHAVLTR